LNENASRLEAGNCFASLFFYGNRMIKFRWFYPASDLPKDGFAVANL